MSIRPILGFPEVVKYACSCGNLKSLNRLFFCKYCFNLKCATCLYHEVDTHFCAHCLENVSANDAQLHKNRCQHCVICQTCGQTFSVRAATTLVPDPDDQSKMVPKKMHYLTCLSCRFTSRDAGLPDQPAASGAWPEPQFENQERISNVIDYYKTIVQIEKAQVIREKDQEKKRRSPFIREDRHGLAAALVRKKVGLSFLSPKTKAPHEIKLPEINPSEAVDTIDDLPDDIFDKPFDITTVTTVEQRHRNPGKQHQFIKVYDPIHKPYQVKRSLRCRRCQHSLCKPDYVPYSIKFKIHHTALMLVPEVKILKCDPMKSNEWKVAIKISNPFPHDVEIKFITWEKASEELHKRAEEPVPNLSSLSISQSYKGDVKQDQRGITEIFRDLYDVKRTVEISLPTNPLLLPQRDDTSDYEDYIDPSVYNDEPGLVLWRRSNKIALNLKCLKQDSNHPWAMAGFGLTFNYQNPILSKDQAQPELIPIFVKVLLDFDQIPCK